MKLYEQGDLTNHATVWWLYEYAKYDLWHISSVGNLELKVEIDGKLYRVYGAYVDQKEDRFFDKLVLKAVEE